MLDKQDVMAGVIALVIIILMGMIVIGCGERYQTMHTGEWGTFVGANDLSLDTPSDLKEVGDFVAVFDRFNEEALAALWEAGYLNDNLWQHPEKLFDYFTVLIVDKEELTYAQGYASFCCTAVIATGYDALLQIWAHELARLIAYNTGSKSAAYQSSYDWDTAPLGPMWQILESLAVRFKNGDGYYL